MTGQTLSIEEIMQEYDRTRLANKRRLQERTEEVYKAVPAIEKLARESKLSYLAAARARVSNDTETAAKLQSENRARTAKKQQLLIEAGYPANYLDPIYQCKDCRDTGYITDKRCHCFLSRIVDSLYMQSNLKNVLAQENFDTFSFEYYDKTIPQGKTYSPFDNITSIVKSAKEFVANFGTPAATTKNMLIYGETGLGKTFLTNCVAKGVLDKGHSVLYLSANELFESILAEYLLNRKTDLEDLFKYIYNTELLIIDDLGTEVTNNFVASQLFEVINKRQLSGRSTLISTNLTMKQFRDRYSERIMSRIISDYAVYNIYGDNIRYQKRKKAIQANS